MTETADATPGVVPTRKALAVAGLFGLVPGLAPGTVTSRTLREVPTSSAALWP